VADEGVLGGAAFRENNDGVALRESPHAFVEKGAVIDRTPGFGATQHGDRPHPAQDEADEGDQEQGGFGDVPQTQWRTEKKRQDGVQKIVWMIRGEKHRARRRQILPPLDDDLAEEDFPDEAKKARKHARLFRLFRWFVCFVFP
jgi:hypothetical protein